MAQGDRFIFSPDFTDLSKEHKGMFDVDKTRKTLTAYLTDGYRSGRTDVYDVVDNKPRLIYSEEHERDDSESCITTNILNYTTNQFKATKECIPIEP